MRLQRFRCHKVVEAGQVVEPLSAADGPVTSVLVTTDEGATTRVKVPADFGARGLPMPGDYLVRYAPDGYLSWSPRAAFEEGYSREEASDADDA